MHLSRLVLRTRTHPGSHGASGHPKDNRHRVWQRTVPVLAFLFCLGRSDIALSEAKAIRRILILNQVGSSYPLSSLVDHGIRSAVDKSPLPHAKFFRGVPVVGCPSKWQSENLTLDSDPPGVIDEIAAAAALPPSSIVLDPQLPRSVAYEWYIAVGITLILAQTMCIFALLWHRRRRERSVAYSRNLVRRAPVAMAVSRGSDHRNELVNHKFTDLFGYTIEDLPDEARWWTLAYPDRAYRETIKAEWEGHLGRLLRQQDDGEPMVARVQSKDGTIRNIEFHFAVFGDSRLVSFVDVTDRQLDQAELREREERFRVVANAAPVMIWMSGPDKLRDYFNQSWLEFTGQPVQAELGNGWVQDIYPEDLEFCLDTCARAFDQRQSWKMQYRLRRNDGEYRWVFDIGVPRFNSDGSFAGYIGSCLDVTERKLAEDALARLSGQLIEAQEKERKRIAREIHDDYNQRLAVLAIDIERLAQNVEEVSAVGGQQLHELFYRVSDLSVDLHSLSHRLHSSTLEGLGLVAGVKAFCTEFTEQNGIQIDFAHDNVPRGIPGDVALCIFRIAQEALRNIKRHSGANSAEVRLEWIGEKLHLSVADRGKGFDSNKPSLHRGIGIQSMEERLRVLGGRLEIYSRPMQGARIEAWLPFKVSGHRAGS